MAEGRSRTAILGLALACTAVFGLALAGPARAGRTDAPAATQAPVAGAAPVRQSREDADRKSAGCLTCHTETAAKTMHTAKAVVLGCTDCHGGDATVKASGSAGSKPYDDARQRAHVRPR